ncbi:hypothetical protein DN545_35080 [Burkholderia multivorans]|nr:hypothetical protein DN545_35080 [Burkholderia multivorans]
MKLIRRAAVSALAAVALVIAPAASADAANVSFDVTKLTADNLVVSDSNCKYFNVYLKYRSSGTDSWTVMPEIIARHGYAGDLFLASTFRPNDVDRRRV